MIIENLKIKNYLRSQNIWLTCYNRDNKIPATTEKYQNLKYIIKQYIYASNA